ncbi:MULTISPECIES: aminotransferase class I/II-fold pyridoxal phosphate-dependent enzyme [Arthrobacter]|uniref:cysteine-S-conjugate beta-lyase n=2 Tax=Arthrobacter TaxID=1663 RepID=A0ABU9KL57_9MICC|nr:aminotransferase class I/II-fold pyridoxal phosphate-dependent enzyme [Arthrobacter sp. YJM1]MDP5227632.1 aminotransferase class I/II-fold pyridoxal phosphate-dependent enzyme [Arthrobacter sp. YJM1]
MSAAQEAGSPEQRHPLLSLDTAALSRRRSVKWRAYPPDVLPLWVAEMDAAPPACVLDELRAVVDAGDLGYAWSEPYEQAVAAYAADVWGVPVAREQVRTFANVVAGLTEILRGGVQGEVMMSTPVYGPLAQSAVEAGRTVRPVPLGADWRLDLTAIEDAFADATARSAGCVYVLCNPHNPTGVAHTRAELEALAALAARFGVQVISDEVHSPMALAGATHVPYLEVAAGSDAVILFSASKAWNLAGAKIAAAIAATGGVSTLERLPLSLSRGASQLGVLAQVSALNDGREWLLGLREDLSVARDRLLEAVATHLPEARIVRPEASFLAWIDCRPLGLGPDPAAHFLEHARVALSGGLEFVAGGEGFVRLNFGTHPDLVEEAVRRMAGSLS